MQAEAAKVAKVREVTIAKLITLEKQKGDVEKTRDEIKCVLSFCFILVVTIGNSTYCRHQHCTGTSRIA